MQYMSAHALGNSYRETAEVRLEVTLDTFDRYLYRERPPEQRGLPYKGVLVSYPASQRAKPWTSPYPPLIPYHHPVSVGRYVALHAACVRLPQNLCVLLPGKRGAGKTSVSRLLCADHGGSLLTDEAAFIHRRTVIVEPLIFAMGIKREGGTGKVLMPAEEICGRLESRPAPVTHIVALRRDAGVAALRTISPEMAFRRLSSHQIDVGASADESVVTLARLCADVPAYEFCWQQFDQLAAACNHLVGALVDGGAAGGASLL
ncbi:hypothetical protein [Bradyrhizobium sp. Cp5.3]|uniref:hypothetical protein n=1 Tax=Bradyrhizobium sp. Cp5.3 TaxID=443598 RepID=UPI0005523DAC|nr:hypothetical protein [Bradyrhizobium sp. Cp5.3]